MFYEKVDVYNKNLGLGLRPPPQKNFISKKKSLSPKDPKFYKKYKFFKWSYTLLFYFIFILLMLGIPSFLIGLQIDISPITKM